jgi:ABC-2 type transport system permease protein
MSGGLTQGLVLPVVSLWRREIVRFCRQRSRLVGAFVQPLLFWVLLGGGLRASFQPPGTPPGTSYVEYVYPGIIAMVLLFTAIFSTISVVEDRRDGFLQGVLVAPVARPSIVMGQALGGTTLAVMQGVLFLLLAPVAGISLTAASVFWVTVAMALVAFGLTSLGLLIAWRLDSTSGFHAIMNLILLPMWVLSGAFFPATGVPVWLGWLMGLNPLTYGMAAIRRCLYLGRPIGASGVPPLSTAMGVTLVFCVLAFAAAAGATRRSAA